MDPQVSLPPLPEVGTSIQLYFDRGMSKPRLGVVNVRKQNLVTALVYTADGRMVEYRNCRYRNDPWWDEHAEKIGTDDFAMFELTESETERRETHEITIKLLAIAEQQAKAIGDLEQRLTVLEGGAPKTDAETAFPPRKPGRPRKIESLEPAEIPT
jgi:hypothetical protein